MSCPLNSHYKSCGTACPATCQDPFGSRPCTLACVETCQCDPGLILDGDTCVPSSQCGCTHNGYSYHSNQTFWADEGCTQRCACDPNTHQMQCHSDSCGPDEHCGLQDGVRSCVPHRWQTCMHMGHHIVTFDQHDYDLHGTCQYQLMGMCEQRQGLDGIEVYIQTDGHLESALHVLVNVSGVLVKLNSKNTENIEVSILLSFHFVKSYWMIKLDITKITLWKCVALCWISGLQVCFSNTHIICKKKLCIFFTATLLNVVQYHVFMHIRAYFTLCTFLNILWLLWHTHFPVSGTLKDYIFWI